MATLLNPFLRALDANADSVSGGLLYVFEAGTTTPVTTYSDRAMTTPQDHPLDANSAGEFAGVFVPSGTYKIRVADSGAVVLYEIDNVRMADRPDDPVFLDNHAAIIYDTTPYTTGTVINGDKDGSKYEVAASGATDHTDTRDDGAKLYNLTGRNAKAAGIIAELPDGTVREVGGYKYVSDSTKTGSASATSDLGVDGLTPEGDIFLEHYGASNDSDSSAMVLQSLLFGGNRPVSGSGKTVKAGSKITFTGSSANLRDARFDASGNSGDKFKFSGASVGATFRDLYIDAGGTGIIFTADGGDDSTTVEDFVFDAVEGYDAVSFIQLSAGGASGFIRNSRARLMSSVAVRIGWNDYDNSTEIGPIAVTGNLFEDVYHGPLVYSPNAVIDGNIIKNVGDASNLSTNGIYTKARNSIVANNMLVDAGYGQGSINMKGSERGSTLTPLGFGVVCLGNSISYTADYASVSTTAGIKIDAGDSLLVANSVDGATSSAIQTGGQFDRMLVGLNSLYSDGTSNGLIYLPMTGSGHRVVMNTAYGGSSGSVVRVQGQDDATDVAIIGNLLEGGTNGVELRPTSDSVLSANIDGNLFKDNATRHIYNAGRLKKLKLTNNEFEGAPSSSKFTWATAESVYINSNEGITTQTTAGAVTTVFSLPVARDTITSVRYRITASDGTDHFCKVVETAFIDSAGTVTEIGSPATVLSHASAGTTGWLTQFNLGTAGQITFQVRGATGKTVNWRFDVTVIG